jgi:hypothetical protein
MQGKNAFEGLMKIRQYLLTGVSYAIPFVACGGIMIAFAIAFAPMTATGPDFSNAPTLKLILDIGSAAFSLLLPVLAGYISFAIAGRPGLVPGFVGGFLASHIPTATGEASAGFLGALLANRMPRRKPLFVWLLIASRVVYLPIAFLPSLFPSIDKHALLAVLITLVAVGSILSNASTPPPPPVYEYEDPFCHRSFGSLEAYERHLGYHRHPCSVEVIEVHSGRCVDTLDWRDGRWYSQDDHPRYEEWTE